MTAKSFPNEIKEEIKKRTRKFEKSKVYKEIVSASKKIETLRAKIDALHKECEKKCNAIEKKGSPEKSERAKAVEKYLKEHDFGCQTDNVRGLCAVLLGEPIGNFVTSAEVRELQDEYRKKVEDLDDEIHELQETVTGSDFSGASGVLIVYDHEDGDPDFDWIGQGAHLFVDDGEDCDYRLRDVEGNIEHIDCIDFNYARLATNKEVDEYIKASNLQGKKYVLFD